MDSIAIEYLNNKTGDDIIASGDIRLSPFAKIMNSSLSGNLFLGLSSCINRSVLGRYVGVAYFSYLADCHSGNYCTFGSRVSVGAFSHPTNALTVHEVGYRNTTASYGETVVKFDSQSYLDERAKKTDIGNDVWVGDNSVIIKGVRIGNGAIVAAGSIVTKDVEPYAIVGGNPARTIRFRFSPEIIDQIQKTDWWERSMADLEDIPFHNIGSAIEMLNDPRPRQAKK